MTQNTSSAVMQQRAAASVEADDAQRALWRKLDYFPTPPWAARACGELIKTLDPRAQSAWDPACGEGHFLYGLSSHFYSVHGSDIHDHRGVYEVCDFLLAPRSYEGRHDWIVTNPPFRLATQFVGRAFEFARRGVLMLCRLSFLESAERFALFQNCPLTVVSVFSERVPMQLGSWDPDLSTATSYAAFVFQRRQVSYPALRFFPPGTRARLSLPDDVRLFAARTETPLFPKETVA